MTKKELRLWGLYLKEIEKYNKDLDKRMGAILKEWADRYGGTVVSPFSWVCTGPSFKGPAYEFKKPNYEEFLTWCAEGKIK